MYKISFAMKYFPYPDIGDLNPCKQKYLKKNPLGLLQLGRIKGPPTNFETGYIYHVGPRYLSIEVLL